MGGKIPVTPLGSPPASDTDFKIQSRRPDVRFLSRGVQPPSGVYVHTNDDLIVVCATSQTGEVVTVSYRLLRPDGLIVLGQFRVTPPNTRAATTHIESLSEGFLLSVSCKATSATTRGQTFVRVFLSDPALGGGQPSYMLMADYVTTAIAPAHPNGRVLSPVEGPGWPNTVIITGGPATSWVINVPINARWKLRAVFVTLTTSGIAGNRLLFMTFIGTGTSAFRVFAIDSQPPSTTYTYSFWATGTGTSTVANLQSVAPLPQDLVLTKDYQVQEGLFASGAGDSFSFVSADVEEWLDNV